MINFYKLLLVLLAIFFSYSEVRGQDQALAALWLNNDIQLANQTLEAKSSYHFDASTTSTTVVTGSDPKRFTITSSVKKNGDNYLTCSLADSVKPSVIDQSVQGINSRYYFVLERNKVGTNWLLTRIEDAHSSSVDEHSKAHSQFRASVAHPVDALTKLPLRIGSTSSFKIFDLPHFTLTSAVKLVDGNHSILVYKFEYDYTDISSKSISRQKCAVEFDVENYGLPRSFLEFNDNPANLRKSTITIQCAKSGDVDVFTYSSAIQVGKDDNVKQKYETASTITMRYVRVPVSDFTLSAFGITEPPGFEAPRTPLYVWFLAIAALCFVLTVGFRLLARRRSNA